jgi:hypothetical protein
MMFTRLKDPKDSIELIPMFVPVDQTREEIYLELRSRMKYDPDDTYVVVLIDGGKVKGLVVAYTREHDVFAWQVRKDPDVPAKVLDMAFDGLKDWARGKKKHRINAVPLPNRPRKLWHRRWGYKDSPTNEYEVYMEI